MRYGVESRNSRDPMWLRHVCEQALGRERAAYGGDGTFLPCGSFAPLEKATVSHPNENRSVSRTESRRRAHGASCKADNSAGSSCSRPTSAPYPLNFPNVPCLRIAKGFRMRMVWSAGLSCPCFAARLRLGVTPS